LTGAETTPYTRATTSTLNAPSLAFPPEESSPTSAAVAHAHLQIACQQITS
jgi:hypothetical protein